MSNINKAWGPDGALTNAFNLDDDPEQESVTKESEREPDESEPDPSPTYETEGKFADDGRYPHKNKKEASRSLERAKENEPSETFEKIAEAIVDEHPELAHEKLAGLGYSIGRQIGRGLLDAIESDSG